MFFTSNVWCSFRLLQLKTEGQTVETENLTKKLQRKKPMVTILKLAKTLNKHLNVSFCPRCARCVLVAHARRDQDRIQRILLDIKIIELKLHLEVRSL